MSVGATYRPPDLIKLQNWVAHIQSKALHFDAAAQYRKANEELENGRYVRARQNNAQSSILHRYGQEISRLQSARKRAKEGSEMARKGSVSASVLNDLNVGVGDWPDERYAYTSHLVIARCRGERYQESGTR